MNKQELITKIKQLQDLSHDERAYLVDLVNTKKKYGLVWEDKPETVEEQLRTQLPILKEVVERRILAKDLPQTEKKAETKQATLFDNDDNKDNNDNPDNVTLSEVEAPNHILIEGDNLHALTALTFTHEGQIDVMYFDPPYNTGNKDFKYNDSFVDREDSYRHSKWLSFMDKRLRIAKRLLSEKGVVFISIDDNEQAQLRLLCDEVFGEGNFVANVIWRSADSSNNDAKQFSLDHNDTYIYSKSSQWSPNLIERTEKHNEHYKNPDNDPNGPWFAGNVSSPNPRKNLQYDIISPNGNKISSPKNGWRWSEVRVNEMIETGEISFSEDNTRIIKKTYLKNQKGIPPSTLWIDIDETGHNRNAKYELIKLFPNVSTSDLFSTPKPTKFITKILKLSTRPSFPSKILDIFAGSGTTLHATMQLNAEDGGNRQCILVTNNENNIAEEVCYERNRRVIQGYTNSKVEWVPGLTNNNLRYYKSEVVGREPSLKNKRELTKLATELLCIKEDCYGEQTLPFKHARLFTSPKTELLVIYDDHVIPDAVEFIKTQLNGVTIKVYVFSMGSDPYTEDFYEVSDKVELCALPDAIYKAYRNVLPKNKPHMVITEDNSADNELFSIE